MTFAKELRAQGFDLFRVSGPVKNFKGTMMETAVYHLRRDGKVRARIGGMRMPDGGILWESEPLQHEPTVAGSFHFTATKRNDVINSTVEHFLWHLDPELPELSCPPTQAQLEKRLDAVRNEILKRPVHSPVRTRLENEAVMLQAESEDFIHG